MTMGRILPDLRLVDPTAIEQPPRSKRGRPRGRQRRITIEAVKACLARGMTIGEVAAELKCSRGAVENRRREAGLVKKRGEFRNQSRTRHESKSIAGATVTMPAFDHPALNEQRTLFPSTVVPVEGANSVLVDGTNSWKIGAQITKGRWRSFRIYTLTLQERATCPTSCAVWRSCYGNSMHMARRLEHGPALEDRLFHELAVLQSRHPNGFTVRLHVLGDFYSVEYVELWRSFLARFPALHVFGFSARHDADDPIAIALAALIAEQWDRFAIRLSNAPMYAGSTVTIEHPLQRPSDAIVCPQQLGKTASCATCALCWQSRKRIAFLRH